MARQQLSFATFNLRNLNLPGQRIHSDEDGWSQVEYDAKIAWTAKALIQLDADVIGFQELWHPQALIDAFTAAGLEDEYDIAAPPAQGRIANAIAVRTPHELTDVRWLVSFPERFVLRKHGRSAAGSDEHLEVQIRDYSRPLVHATVKARQGRRRPIVEVIVCHLKSKRPTRLEARDRRVLPSADEQALGRALSTVRRLSEAAALRMLLNDLMDGETPVVVLGDLNDPQLSDTTEVVSGDPGYRLFAASRAGGRSGRGLYAAATMQEYRSLRDVYYTHIHEGVRESLDHVFVSQHFYDYAKARLWSFRQLRTINDHLEDTRSGFSPASDHAPVVATFDLNPARPA